MRRLSFLLALLATLIVFGLGQRWPLAAADKPLVTFDEFFNSVEYNSVQISPDGGAVAIQTTRSEWDAHRYRTDLWLYHVAGAGGALIPLTQSGHERAPQWSPDGRWIAFLSDRGAQKAKGEAEDEDDASDSDSAEKAEQVYVISAVGGEAFPVTAGEDSVHAFAWSADSRAIFFATRQSQSKDEKAAWKKEWKDVIRYREAERGDEIFRVDVAAIESTRQIGTSSGEIAPATHEIAKIADRVMQLSVSPDGARLAFCTDSRSEREETLDTYSIFAIEIGAGGEALGQPQVVSHTQVIYDHIHWANDSRHIFFIFLYGSVEGAYQDAQPRVYWVDAGPVGTKPLNGGAQHSRWAASFGGAMAHFDVLA